MHFTQHSGIGTSSGGRCMRLVDAPLLALTAAARSNGLPSGGIRHPASARSARASDEGVGADALRPGLQRGLVLDGALGPLFRLQQVEQHRPA